MSKVYASLAGGIGNQLFQVASAFSYGRHHDKDVRIDVSNWSASQGRSPLEYENTIFKNFIFEKSPIDALVCEEGKIDYRKLKKHKGDILFNGYFQSHGCFFPYDAEFKDLLCLPIVKNFNLEEKNVAFHIRRGDYKHYSNIHLVCDTKYFDKCFEMFKDYQVNVFTDDPEHVLREFEHQDFNLLQTSSELGDLTLMSQHDNIVMSNSSFSWWASFLGKHKEEIISPSKWFADGREDESYFRNDFRKI